MLVWISFLALVTLFLALDLGVFNKNAHIISVKEASIWTAIWITMALLFSFVVHWVYANGFVANPTNITPNDASLKYITGYLIEKSLSIDNIFVIAVIFKSFKIPMIYQHRVLFWGVFGAIIFRAIMIFFGVLLINKFSFMTYIFGAFLLFTAFKMLRKQEEEEEFNPKKSWIYRNIRKVIPITSQIDKERFWVRKKHLLVATPLFVALVVIEIMDVLFAIDSVPAILAITADPFLVFTSNIFAILGLRSMYFFLSNMLKKFQYLEYSLIAILTFVGIKMLFVHYYKLPEWASLGFISLALTIGIWISIKKMNEVTEE